MGPSIMLFPVSILCNGEIESNVLPAELVWAESEQSRFSQNRVIRHLLITGKINEGHKCWCCKPGLDFVSMWNTQLETHTTLWSSHIKPPQRLLNTSRLLHPRAGVTQVHTSRELSQSLFSFWILNSLLKNKLVRVQLLNCVLFFNELLWTILLPHFQPSPNYWHHPTLNELLCSTVVPL